MDTAEKAIFLLFALIIWVANFWHSASFGLYEDDWGRVPVVLEMQWNELLNLLIHETGGQGRPFHEGLIYLFSFLGVKLGGLPYIYLFGFGVIVINACLFYILLKKLYGQVFAITGALTFCVFPADTTRDYLTHSLGVQPSLGFLLIAFHCYLFGNKKLSYFVIFLSLIAYEPLFTVFFAAPLFERQWNSRLSRELLKHGLILFTILACMAVLRKIAGEGQISGFGLRSFLLLVFNPIIGSITSFAMLIFRSLETLLKLNGELWIFCLLSFLGFIWLLSYLRPGSPDEAFSLETLVNNKKFAKIPNFFKTFGKPIVTSLVALMLAYPLTMTSYGFAISGRTTRVHAGAIIGVSILSACICSAILFAANKYGRKRLAVLGLAGFFALLVGFGVRVQQDYQLMWQHQRGFWTDMIRLCPDITEGTAIFVEPTGLRDTRQPIPFRESRGKSDPKQIKGLEWELPSVLQQIYRFPNNWQFPPKAYRLQSDWQDKILSDRGLLRVSAAIQWLPDADLKREVESSNVIFLETKNGELTRRVEPLVIANQKFKLKEQSVTGLPPFKKKYLYNYLIKNSNEEPTNYLIKN